MVIRITGSKKIRGIGRKCALLPLWGHMLPFLPKSITQTETLETLCLQGSVAGSCCSSMGRGWPKDPRGDFWKKNPGTGSCSTVGLSCLSGTHFSPYCPPATQFVLPSGPLPALPVSPAHSPPSPRSPQHEHGIDGSGHLLVLPSTILYPPLMPCPHLYLGNHLLLCS